MDERLRRYIDGLFDDVPQTKSMLELKEEMFQNLIEKYEDLIKEGKSHEAAFNIAVAGIGDINELIEAINKPQIDVDIITAKQKSAMLVSITVTLYMLSLVPIILWLGTVIEFFTGVLGFIIMIAFATGLLIYNGMTKPRIINDEAMTNEFREWKISKDQRRKTRISISVALWSLLFALYFFISFMTYRWYITWIIFILGFAIEALINIFITLKK